MRLDRVYDLAVEYGFTVNADSNYGYSLYDDFGSYVDTLHAKQIEELHEDDFIMYYLED